MPRTRIGTLLLVAALIVAACGDDDADSDVTVPPDETTSSTSSSTSSTTEDPTAAVEAAFYDQWDAFVEITSDPDINNPLIDQHFAGAAKEAVLDGVSRLLADGHAIRLPDDPSDFQPRIVQTNLTDDRAVVFECTIEGLVVYDRTTREIINDTISNYKRKNTFELIDERWIVTDTVPLDNGDPGCGEL